MIAALLLIACTGGEKDKDTASAAGDTGTAADDTGSPADDTEAPPEDTEPDPVDTAQERDDAVRAIDPSDLPQGASPCREPGLFYVEYVYDGDTLFVHPDGQANADSEKIRVLSLDAPEVESDYGEADCYGDEAAAYLAELIEGRVIWMTFDAKCEDEYERTLAYLHVGLEPDGFINRNLLRYGYARTFFWDDGLTATFDDDFAQDEAAAQDEGLGLWSACY
jgi:micrococcal nuclease